MLEGASEVIVFPQGCGGNVIGGTFLVIAEDSEIVHPNFALGGTFFWEATLLNDNRQTLLSTCCEPLALCQVLYGPLLVCDRDTVRQVPLPPPWEEARHLSETQRS